MEGNRFMKAQFLNRSVGINDSIALQTHTGNYFKKIWHYHPELELMAVFEGTGSVFVGDYISKFEPGTLVLIGKNLPHLWQNDKTYFAKGSRLTVNAKTIHFNENFAGSLLEIPEMIEIARLLKKASCGIMFSGPQNGAIHAKIDQMFSLTGYDRIMSFLDVLQCLTVHPKTKVLSSSGYVDSFNEIRDTKLLPVFEYIMTHFKEHISLGTAASIAHMNPSAFSRFFTSVHKKTFTQFVNEVRIGFACKLLIDGNHSIAGACFESGFNNLSNFNRQFQNIKKMSPSAFIKLYVS